MQYGMLISVLIAIIRSESIVHSITFLMRTSNSASHRCWLYSVLWSTSCSWFCYFLSEISKQKMTSLFYFPLVNSAFLVPSHCISSAHCFFPKTEGGILSSFRLRNCRNRVSKRILGHSYSGIVLVKHFYQLIVSWEILLFQSYFIKV